MDLASTTLNKIQITYKSSSLPKTSFSSDFSGIIDVKINNRVRVYRKINGVYTEISVKSLTVGDIITVNCKETVLNGEVPEITPVTIYDD